jgi:hypothetical protein
MLGGKARMPDVMQELKPIGEKYAAGDFRGGLSLLHELWAQLPEPKPATPNAYMVIEYGVALALKLRDLNEAWVWANRAPDFKEKRQDRGEVEFLIGKVAYEDGKLEMALAQFHEAKRKSRGRLFADADPKYAALLQTK